MLSILKFTVTAQTYEYLMQFYIFSLSRKVFIRISREPLCFIL